MDPASSGFDTIFSAFVGVIALIILVGFVFTAYSMVRGARAAKGAGIDPFTPESVLLAQAVRGRGTSPLEERLAELDDLRARGVISDEERAAARRKALEA